MVKKGTNFRCRGKAGGCNPSPGSRLVEPCGQRPNISGLVKHIGIAILLLLPWQQTAAQVSGTEILGRLDLGVPAGIRALYTTANDDWWVGGSKGWLAHSVDGGQNWLRAQPAGDTVEFRSLYAFNPREAIAATAGKYPGIWRTSDGGNRWREVFHHPNPEAFFDGIDFWNDTCGVAFGDPEASGRLILLYTTDAGKTWTSPPDTSRPLFIAGEVAFAASGTGIRCVGDSTVALISGGEQCRLWYSRNRGQTWSHIRTDIPNPALGGIHLRYPDTLSGDQSYLMHGAPTRGGFSIALTPDSQWAIVGGDYLNQGIKNGAVASNQHGMWWNPRTPTRGYRECVLPVDTFLWLAAGPSGIDITYNGGLDWQAFSDEPGMHVLRLLPDKRILMAGKEGKLLLWPPESYQQPLLGPTLLRLTQDSMREVAAPEVWAALEGNLRHLERKLARWVRLYGNGERSQQGYYTFSGPYVRLVHRLKGIPGVNKIWVDSCGARILPYPARGNIEFQLPAIRGTRPVELSLLFYEGGLRRPYWMRYVLGQVWGEKNRLTQPKLIYTRDKERWDYRLCAWSRRPPWHPIQ